MPVMRRGESITYWAPKKTDVFGNTEFAYPRVVYGRWEDVAEMYRSVSGEEVVSKSVVYLDDLDDISIDGYLYRGISTKADPKQQEGSVEIRQRSSIPNLRNLRQIRVAYL